MKESIYYFFKYHFFGKTRSFIKHIYRKYVLWYNYWSEKRLCKRQERHNKHFRWSKENVEKTNYLNQYLTNLMEEVYSDCVALKKQHDKWISEGKSYYKNYEIIGYIVHTETDPDNYGIRKTNFTEAQDYVTDNKAWCIRLSDPEFCKTELLKENQFKNYRWWGTEFSATLKEHGVENTCAFLDSFLNVNKAYSLKDFVRMTEDNFCKNIEVNYVY
ncbi:MAG: hypothetical protein MJ179_01240 [Treponema sp.]|nr:hypothetical protein [Treponema sp.]